VSMQLFVKERDTNSQHLTLDVKIDGQNPLVATSSNTDFDRALNEVRDEIDELFDILGPWGETIRAGKGYLGAGPHDLG